MAQMFIGGQSVGATGDEVTEIRNPATGELVDTVPRGTAEDVRHAADAAEEAAAAWAGTATAQREAILMRAAALVKERVAEVAALLTR